MFMKNIYKRSGEFENRIVSNFRQLKQTSRAQDTSIGCAPTIPPLNP